MRRVVITGLGLVTPVGCGVEESWSNLLQGKSGARRVEEFEVSDISCQIACFVPRGATSEGKFNADDWMEPKEQRKVDDFIIYAVAAADQALADSGYKPTTTDEQERAGVLIGSGIGGLSGIADTSLLLKEKGPRRVSPFFIPGRLINLAAGYVSIKHQLRGPNHAVVDGPARPVRMRLAMLLASSPLATPTSWLRAAPKARSAASRSQASPPAAPSRPASTTAQPKGRAPTTKDRDGFVMGEGAGVVVLEEYEACQGARRQDLRRGHRLRHVGRTPITSQRPPRAAMAPSAAWPMP